MYKNYYPTGKPQYFEYSDYKPFDMRNAHNLFGIVFSKIKAPVRNGESIKAPILLTESEGKVIAPTGT